MNRAPSVWEDMNAEILQAALKGCATYLKARSAGLPAPLARATARRAMAPKARRREGLPYQ